VAEAPQPTPDGSSRTTAASSSSGTSTAGSAAASGTSLPATADANANQAGAVYAAAEVAVVVGSAELVRQAIADPAKAGTLYTDLLALARSKAAEVAAQAGPLAASIAARSTTAGDDDARATIAALEAALPHWSPPAGYELGHDANAARMIASDLAYGLAAAATRITWFADDAYRAATVAGALSQVTEQPVHAIAAGLLDKATPAEAQAQAWRDLTAKGVTGFTDSAGRQWSLATYVEMAVRTATQRAYNASHKDRYDRAGLIYYTISTSGRPCPLCAPWEGRVLSDGGAAEITEPSVKTGDPVTFHVDATVEEATAAGLFHPNCRHVLTPFLPGATILKASAWTDADEAAYKATQRLRYLERRVRAARMEYAAAITPDQKAAAGHQIRQRAEAAKAFAADHGLVNRPRRQRLDLGLH
jgi:hypothetical protein